MTNIRSLDPGTHEALNVLMKDEKNMEWENISLDFQWELPSPEN